MPHPNLLCNNLKDFDLQTKGLFCRLLLYFTLPWLHRHVMLGASDGWDVSITLQLLWQSWRICSPKARLPPPILLKWPLPEPSWRWTPLVRGWHAINSSEQQREANKWKYLATEKKNTIYTVKSSFHMCPTSGRSYTARKHPEVCVIWNSLGLCQAAKPPGLVVAKTSTLSLADFQSGLSPASLPGCWYRVLLQAEEAKWEEEEVSSTSLHWHQWKHCIGDCWQCVVKVKTQLLFSLNYTGSFIRRMRQVSYLRFKDVINARSLLS